jgi:hypothetical protein
MVERKEVIIKERGIISPELATKFFGKSAFKARVAATRQVQILAGERPPDTPEARAESIRVAREFLEERDKEILAQATPDITPFISPERQAEISREAFISQQQLAPEIIDVGQETVRGLMPQEFAPIGPPVPTAITPFRTAREMEAISKKRLRETPLTARDIFIPSETQPEVIVEQLGPTGAVLRGVFGAGEALGGTVLALTQPQKLFGPQPSIDIGRPRIVQETLSKVASDPVRIGEVAAFGGLLFAPIIGKGIGRAGRFARQFEVDLGPKITGGPGRLRGAARPGVKLKKKTVITKKEFELFRELRKLEKPTPPRITKVIKKGDIAEIIVEAGGKVVERRLITKFTSPDIIRAQLQAAKLQGAKFINLKAPSKTVTNPFTGKVIPPTAAGAAALRRLEVTGELSARALSQDSLSVLVIPRELLRASEQQRLFAPVSKARSRAQLESQNLLSSLEQTTGISERQITPQAQVTLQSLSQAEAQAQAQVFGQAFLQAEKVVARRPVARPVSPRPRPLRFLPPIPVLTSKKAASIVKATEKGGYDVFSKVKGRAEKINKVPRSKITALSIGAEFTDTTPAASFEIRKAKGKAQGPEINTWDAISGKFRPRRTKKALVLVEKAKHRIDSIGELEGITFKGIDVRKAI